MPNGLDAMRQQRENRRGKPAPMHPRKASEQAKAPASPAAAETAPPSAGDEQSGTPEQQQNGAGSQPRQTRPRRSAPRKSASAAHDPAAAAEGKQVADAALAWSAAARKLGQRFERLRSAVEAAHAAGTPAHVIQAALSNAEYGAEGVELPDEVWRAAGITRP